MDATSTVFDYPGTLARLGHDQSLFECLVQYFLEDIDVLLERLRVALSTSTVAEIELAAHSIKGLCSNFGAQRAIAAAFYIELQAQSQALDGVAEGFQRLVAAVAELKLALTSAPGCALP